VKLLVCSMLLLSAIAACASDEQSTPLDLPKLQLTVNDVSYPGLTSTYCWGHKCVDMKPATPDASISLRSPIRGTLTYNARETLTHASVQIVPITAQDVESQAPQRHIIIWRLPAAGSTQVLDAAKTQAISWSLLPGRYFVSVFGQWRRSGAAGGDTSHSFLIDVQP